MSEKTLEVLRTETKYLVSKDMTEVLKWELGRVINSDIHSINGGYMVRSLYFDTINDRDYITKLAGIENRQKVRLRIYSTNDQTVKLEVKQKFGDLQRKVSLILTKEDALELCQINYSVLTKYFDQSEDAIKIYLLMTQGLYRPAALIEYDRIAYTHPLYSTRVTLDCNIRSTESNLDLYSEDPGYSILLTENNVLEVKYNKKLMRHIADSLRKYNLTKISVSKYCLGRKVFGDFNF